jgi:hypothetical protein
MAMGDTVTGAVIGVTLAVLYFSGIPQYYRRVMEHVIPDANENGEEITDDRLPALRVDETADTEPTAARSPENVRFRCKMVVRPPVSAPITYPPDDREIPSEPPSLGHSGVLANGARVRRSGAKWYLVNSEGDHISPGYHAIYPMADGSYIGKLGSTVERVPLRGHPEYVDPDSGVDVDCQMPPM